MGGDGRGRHRGHAHGGSEARELTLRSLAVLPSDRRRGIATTLVRAALRWAEGNQLTSISLETAVFLEAAVRLYRRLGFTPQDERSNLHGVCTVRITRPTAPPGSRP